MLDKLFANTETKNKFVSKIRIRHSKLVNKLKTISLFFYFISKFYIYQVHVTVKSQILSQDILENF